MPDLIRHPGFFGSPPGFLGKPGMTLILCTEQRILQLCHA